MQLFRPRALRPMGWLLAIGLGGCAPLAPPPAAPALPAPAGVGQSGSLCGGASGRCAHGAGVAAARHASGAHPVQRGGG